jgi:hypothetical protein
MGDRQRVVASSSARLGQAGVVLATLLFVLLFGAMLRAQPPAGHAAGHVPANPVTVRAFDPPVTALAVGLCARESAERRQTPSRGRPVMAMLAGALVPYALAVRAGLIGLVPPWPAPSPLRARVVAPPLRPPCSSAL